jgi:diketogulonate reductase-like aldo/keto reductase
MPVTGERLTTNPELVALAARKGVTVAKLLIAWGLKRGYGVLPKSSTKERIRSNFELVELSAEEFEEVNRRTEGREHRFVDMTFFGFDVDWE